MSEYTRIAKLLKETYEAELNDEIKKVENNTAQIEFVPSDKYRRKMDKLCKKMSRPYWQFFNTAGKRAACVAGALLILSGASLSVSAVREGLQKFVTAIFSDHTEVSVDADENSYPTVIENEYSITQLPKGFKEVDKSVNEVEVFRCYFNDDKYIFFKQYSFEHYKVSYDNEYSEYKTINSDGQDYLVIFADEDDSYTFIWDNGEYVFEVKSNLPENEVQIICESVDKAM